MTTQKGITSEAINTFLKNQGRELELRVEELILQKQKDNHAFEYGKAALETKAADRNLQRKHDLKARGYTYSFAAFISLLILGIMFYGIFSGNKDVTMEIIKAIVYLASGGLGGYGLARSKADESKYSSNKLKE